MLRYVLIFLLVFTVFTDTATAEMVDICIKVPKKYVDDIKLRIVDWTAYLIRYIALQETSGITAIDLDDIIREVKEVNKPIGE